MFEDSTFESAGRIRTRSRRWMIAAFTFNASILLAFVLVPLLYLEALPPQAIPILITLPPAPQVQEQQPKPVAQTPHPPSEIDNGHIFAPPRIPRIILYTAVPEQRFTNDDASLEPGVPGSTGPFIPGQSAPRVVHPSPAGPVRVATPVEEGLLIYKRIPVYPPIATTARVQGTVALAATISKKGTIENLRVVSGPAMLQQSALDAVSTWRYKPYMLDGDPVEVETTVNVVFTLGR
ncbi:MAG: TonB family protein [Terracidiphilus sp.]|jgi:protein TonB